jgi:hypothetical protein
MGATAYLTGALSAPGILSPREIAVKGGPLPGRPLTVIFHGKTPAPIRRAGAVA